MTPTWEIVSGLSNKYHICYIHFQGQKPFGRGSMGKWVLHQKK